MKRTVTRYLTTSMASVRRFNTSNYMRSSPMVGQALNDDEFLPEFEEKELAH